MGVRATKREEAGGVLPLHIVVVEEGGGGCELGMYMQRK